MDHFLLPKDPVPLRIPRVRYVCVEKYDGGPFLTYPTRKGMPWVTPNPTDKGEFVPYLIRERLQPTHREELEPFFQTWLFFGFLSEVLDDFYHEEDFIAKNETSPAEIFISTANLLPVLTEALKLGLSGVTRESQEPKPSVSLPKGLSIGCKNESQGKRNRLEHISNCLELSASTLGAAGHDFDWGVKYSIASMCEVVAYTVYEAFRRLGIDPETRIHTSWDLGFYQEEIKNQMLGAGWCPSDISRAMEHFHSTQTLGFLSRMSRLSQTKRDHQRCTPQQCISFQIDMKTYRERHREAECNCKDLSPDPENILAALRGGALPLLKVIEVNGDLDSLQVEIVESKIGMPYIAISHVWADGLGNPLANSLPRCQLSNIYKLASALSASISLTEPDVEVPRYIWLDTICCPVESKGKSLALAQMRRTYEGASHVLVLDASLQCYDSQEIGPAEALARIFTSGWMQRLWTLQEGALAVKLWFQFRDGSVELNLLMGQLSTLVFSGTDVRYWPLSFSMYSEHRALRSFKHSLRTPPAKANSLGEIQAAQDVGGVLAALDTGLLHRSTSVAADEALCIGTLLDLPVEEILAVPENADSRMAKVWKLVGARYGGIPQQILHFDQPTIEEKGMGWAPKSLLSVSKTIITPASRSLRWMDEKLGIPTDAGLVVQCPGFTLKSKEAGDGILGHPWEVFGKVRETFLLFMSNRGVRYKAYVNYNTLTPSTESEKEDEQRECQYLKSLVREGSCAMILLREHQNAFNQTMWDGIAVRVIESTAGTHYVHLERHISVTEIPARENYLWSTTARLAQTLRQDPLTAKVASLMSDTESVAYKDATEALKLKMQHAASEACEDPALADALKAYAATDDPRLFGVYWRVVADWYSNDFVGSWLPDGQKWCVD
ncbi:hypothetical protein MMC24_001874 [Lignoscripta atroalba]|nr:hypothetical protein [Lignoscripta atroalba]